MARPNREYKIRAMVCDWALDIPMGDTTFVLYFSSRNNAELVKEVLEWEDAHPNEATPYQPTLTPPNEPMTLEQLRGTPHGKIKDKTLQHICDRANELAYAYPTAHIGREKWEPCDVCSNAKHIVGLALAIMGDGSDHRVDTKMNCEYSFCPNCGRPLTDEAWAELERRVCGEV